MNGTDMAGKYNWTKDPQCTHVSRDGIRCTKNRAYDKKRGKFRSTYCWMHYQRHRRGTDMDAPVQKQDHAGTPTCCHQYEDGSRCMQPRARRKERDGRWVYRSRYCNMHASRKYMVLDMDAPKYMAGQRDSLIYG